MALFEVRGLKKAFGRNAVLRGLDLDIFAGEVITIIGESGSGKSVLLKAMMGLLDVDGGTIRFGGDEVTMASVGRRGPPRVGRYGVDVEALDGLTERYLGHAEDTDLYVVDEIGKMECFSRSFIRAMRRLLDGPTPLVATVGLRGRGLVADAKTWPGTELWQVTRENRDEMPDRVLLWLRAAGSV